MFDIAVTLLFDIAGLIQTDLKCGALIPVARPDEMAPWRHTTGYDRGSLHWARGNWNSSQLR